MGVLRLLLALSVLVAHMHGEGIFGFRLLYGNLAVECFFMISGFYMALVLNEKYNRSSDYLPFLWQRVLRLFPAYLTVLLVTLLVEGILSLAAGAPIKAYGAWFAHAGILSPVTWAALIGANLFIVGQQFALFQGIDPVTGSLFFTGRFLESPIPATGFIFVTQAWTLDLEITFYLLAPLLVRRSAWIQVLVLGLSVGLRMGTSWMLNPLENPWHNDRFFPYELGFFMAGSIAYQIYRHQKELLARLNGFTNWFRWVFLGIVLFYSRLPGNSYLREAILIPLMFVMIPLLFNFTKNHRVDRLIGELSYPFYLIHALVLNVMRPFIPLYFPQVLHGPIYATMTIAMAYVIYRCIDERVDNFRHLLFARRRQVESAPTPENRVAAS